MEEQKLKQLAQPLLAWYDIHRRILPWREEVSPYRTWVSEIMLQQTRVAAVLPYFQRFMEAFPTVGTLAQADTERLMKLWEGLGYYSRARNLQKAARILTEQYGGRFPETYRELTALPGIGDYTAGAILSIAFGQAVPAVDGNVLRLAARITGSRLDVLDAKNRKIFRSWMAAAMSQERPGAYNQALMDLGATDLLTGDGALADAGEHGVGEIQADIDLLAGFGIAHTGTSYVAYVLDFAVRDGTFCSVSTVPHSHANCNKKLYQVHSIYTKKPVICRKSPVSSF
jgi:A/G-specific adenine glycosylase